MKIGEVLKDKQPKEYDNLKPKKKHKDKTEEDLSFNDIMNLMKHDSYGRHRGALRRR
jgi:hypothetical protein